MKALVCSEFGPLENLSVMERDAPTVGAGQVLIDVKAASVNFPDALTVLGKYQTRPPTPFVAGAEMSGIVRAIGEGVRHLQVGMPVIALPMTGAFAEQVVCDAKFVIPLDPAVDLATAAALPMTYGTMYHALVDRGRLQAGETLLVLGAGGGIGTAAIELGKILGATVIAAASSAAKLDAARQCGADHLIDYSQEDLRARLKEITGGKGVDVICDPVGGSYSEPALRSMAWEGRFLVIGFAAGDIPRIPLNLTLLKGCSIVGVFWGDFMRRDPRKGAQEMLQLIAWLREGRIHPLISARFPLAEGAAALQHVAARLAVGKVLILP
jgi:NADPH2:quinone reductase